MSISFGNLRSTVLAKIVLPAILLLIMAGCTQGGQGKSDSASVAPPASSASTSNSAAADSSLPDPCKLLTKAEAEAILGEAIRDPEPGGLGGSRICEYKTVTVHGGVLPYYIHIGIIPEQQQVWDAGKKLHLQSDAKETRPVAGIADDAYFLLEDLDIFTKQRSVTITVLKSIDKPDHAKAVQEAEMAVAQKIIPRM
jgi:hypothetical protein